MLALVLFASGATALIDQVLWSKQLALVAGVTAITFAATQEEALRRAEGAS
jgi:hypothetical protein